MGKREVAGHPLSGGEWIQGGSVRQSLPPDCMGVQGYATPPAGSHKYQVLFNNQSRELQQLGATRTSQNRTRMGAGNEAKA